MINVKLSILKYILHIIYCSIKSLFIYLFFQICNLNTRTLGVEAHYIFEWGGDMFFGGDFQVFLMKI